MTHPVLGEISVGPILPARSYELRQQVLRPHQRVEEMGHIDSGDPEELVVGALGSAGEVVATGAVMPAALPEGLGELAGAGRAWRVRGMATRPDLRGAGIGTAVLGALFDHVATCGGGIVWC
ncbi:MAG: GNAT family N-acetyltransferase, partial [Acidimicrobiales bacterium]